MKHWLGFNSENSERDKNAHLQLYMEHDQASVSRNKKIDSGESFSGHSSSDEWTEDRKFEMRILEILIHCCIQLMCGPYVKLSFSPGEGQTPLGLYQDKNAEYLSFSTNYCG